MRRCLFVLLVALSGRIHEGQPWTSRSREPEGVSVTAFEDVVPEGETRSHRLSWSARSMRRFEAGSLDVWLAPAEEVERKLDALVEDTDPLLRVVHLASYAYLASRFTDRERKIAIFEKALRCAPGDTSGIFYLGNAQWRLELSGEEVAAVHDALAALLDRSDGAGKREERVREAARWRALGAAAAAHKVEVHATLVEKRRAYWASIHK